jgi:hypothetical protein
MPHVRAVTIPGWLLIATILQASLPSNESPRMEPAKVAEDIRTLGARKVLERLHAHPQQITAVLEGIRTGDRRWLRIGQDLFEAADAGWAYEINLAFGDALTKSAEAVLEMAPELDVTCGSIDEPFVQSLDKALREVSRREQSVRRVKAVALKQQRARCLDSLSQLRTTLPKGYQK